MQRSSRFWIATVALALGAVGCTDEGVGDPCVPETIPCGKDGEGCGYRASESYVEAASVQCRTRLCIVHQLNNKSTQIPADPRVICTGGADDREGCVENEALLDSVYCTCRCDGPKTSIEFCECPDDFRCVPILNLGGDGIKGSYCIRKGTPGQ